MTARPLITFALFAYNQEKFIREAVEGAFAQTYSPLEIILSDDGSIDRTFEIMSQMADEYNGPHTVILNRNLPNLGLIDHINKIFKMATADIVVVAAGDDISFPDRVSQIGTIFESHPGIHAVTMNYIIIDSSGEVLPNVVRIFKEGKYSLSDFHRKSVPIGGPTSAYKKTIFKIFGPLSPRCQAEDATLFFRSLLLGGTWHQSTYGAYYRIHDNNMTKGMSFEWAKRIYRQNKRDLYRAVNNGYLAGRDITKIEQVLKNRLVRGIVMSRFKKSRFKLFYFFYAIAISKIFSNNEKKSYFMDSVRQLIPDVVISFLKKNGK